MFETKGLDMPTDYVKCHIEKRDWTAKNGKTGSTYCINNQIQETTELFGHKAKITIAKKGEDFNAGGYTIFAWVDKMTDTMHEAFLEEYGLYVYCNPDSKEWITETEFLALDSTATTTSEQATASF